MSTTNSNTFNDQCRGNRRRPRLLLIAYTCRPCCGSEGAIGWNRAIQAGRFADVWVLCEERECKAEIQAYIEENSPVPGVQFVFVPHSNLQARLLKIPGCYYLSYHLWHRQAFAVAQKLHAALRFDFAHQANMSGYREPGLLWRLPIPFVWGPVGGTQNFPYRFLSTLSLRDAAIELTRNIVNSIQLRISPRVRRAARKASQVVAANSTNNRDMTRLCGVHVTTMSDVGISGLADCALREPPDAGRLRILWSGLLEPRKALSLLIEAVSLLPTDLRWSVRVLGDGPLYRSCRRRSCELGIEHRFEWLGWQPREEALKHYSWADVFAFTSLRDTTGTVILEALSHGVPVMGLDHQGVADVVTLECGIKIPVTSPRQVVRDLASAFQNLANDPAKQLRLREGARRRAAIYVWPRLGNQMAECYQQVLTAAGIEAEVRERTSITREQVVDDEVFA